MQVSPDLKCPWCFYQFDKSYSPNTEIGKTVSAHCPKCAGHFTYTLDVNNKFHTTNRCELNGVRHNWKYENVPGYDVHKKCRRCGKENIRTTQTMLPGFREAYT